MCFTQGGNNESGTAVPLGTRIRTIVRRAQTHFRHSGTLLLYIISAYSTKTQTQGQIWPNKKKDETKLTQNIMVRLLKERKRKQHGQQVAHSICNTLLLLNFYPSSSQFMAIVLFNQKCFGWWSFLQFWPEVVQCAPRIQYIFQPWCSVMLQGQGWGILGFVYRISWYYCYIVIILLYRDTIVIFLDK